MPRSIMRIVLALLTVSGAAVFGAQTESGKKANDGEHAARLNAEWVRETQFDKDLIAGSAGIGAALPLANGRQIVRSRSGAWFVGFDSNRGPRLAVAFGARCEGRHFTPALDLGNLLGLANGESRGFSLAIDGNDRLHAVWGGKKGIYAAWCDVSGSSGHRNASRAEAWRCADGSPGAGLVPGTDADTRFGDIAISPDDRVWVAFSRAGRIVVTRFEDAWKSVEVARPVSRWAVVTEPPDHNQYEIRTIEEACREPVLEIGADGTIHVAFAHRWEIYYTRSRDGDHWSVPPADRRRPGLGYWDSPFPNAERVAFAHAFYPSLVLFQGRPLVAYQFEGMANLDPHHSEFVRQRWNGVASVGYAYREEDGWRRGYLSKSKEIMVKRLPPGEGHWTEDHPQ